MRLRSLFRLRPLAESFVRHSEVKRSYSMPSVIIILLMLCIPISLYVVLPKALTMLSGPCTVLSLLLGFVIIYSTGLHLGELCCALPKNNVIYQTAFASIGELPAFLIGWISLLHHLSLISLTARALSLHSFLLFRTSLKSRLFNVNSKYLDIDFDYVALTMIVLVTMIANCGSRVLVCLAICLLSLTLLILSSCTMVTFFHADPQNWIEANFFTYGAEGFFRGICAVCICFSSGEALSMFIEESKVPRRRATPLISSINVLLIFIYFSVFLLFSVSVNVSSLSSQILLPEFFTTMNVPAANSVHELGFSRMRYMLSVGSVCSLFGSLLCLTVPGSRALSSLALDGLIPSPKSPRFSLFICMIVAALSLFIRSSVVFSILLFLAPFRCIIIISKTILQHYCKEPIGIPHETSHYRSMMTSSCELHGSIAESTDSESSTLFIANAARVAEEKLQKKLEEAMNGSMEKEPVMAKSVSQYHTMDVRRPSNHSHEHEHNCIAEACDATSDDDSAHLFSNDPMRIIVPSIASSISPQAKGVASECQRAICLLFLFILSSALLSQIIFNQNGITTSSYVLLIFLLMLMVISIFLISRLTKNDYKYRRHNPIKFFPYSSLFSLGILTCSIGSLNSVFLIPFLAWMGLGLVVYFSYGYFHSSERNSKKSMLKDHQEDLLDTEQYAPIIEEETSQL